MDIPRVLESLHPGLSWGPCCGSYNTYQELSDNWPAANPTLSTEVVMDAEWVIIQAADALLPQDAAEFETRLVAYMANDPIKIQEVLVAYLKEMLKNRPDLISELGVNI